VIELSHELTVKINVFAKELELKNEEVIYLLGSIAYLKNKNLNVMKTLLFDEKARFIELLDQSIEEDEHFPEQSAKFLKVVKGVIETISDSNYREILRTATSFSEIEVINAAIEIQNKSEAYGDIVTPSTLNRLMVELADIQPGHVVVDPTMGSGSTLIETLQYQPSQVIGQEIDTVTALLGYIRLSLYKSVQSKVYIDDVLANPQYLQMGKVERVVSVPPFAKRVTADLSNDSFGRFLFGKPAKNSADWAFVSNAISSLKAGGKAVLLLPDGALFRGGADKKIRESILNLDVLESVISLPSSVLGYGAIPISILVFNKEKAAEAEHKVQFIKVPEDSIITYNRREKVLSEEGLKKVISVYHAKEEQDNFSTIAGTKEIAKNDADFLVSKYVVSKTYEIDGVKVDVDFDQLNDQNTIPLSEVASISRGFNVTANFESKKGEYQVIKISDITDEGIKYQHLTRVVAEGARVDNYVVKKGDLLLSVRGAVNKIGYVDHEVKKVLFNANLVRIRANKTYLPKWLEIYFASPMAKILLDRISNGTTVRQITIKDLQKLPVPIMTLEKQSQAVAKYEKEMQFLETERRLLAKKEANLKRSLYEDMGIQDAFKIND
jgi:type I restriction enzyme M protein